MIPMIARYSSKANRPSSMCVKCDGWIDAGTEILFDRNTRRSQHKVCSAQHAPMQMPLAAKPSQGAVTGAEVAVLVFLLTPATRAFLDANDPKSVEQARNALRVNPLAWNALLDGERFAAEGAEDAVRNETRQADLDATKTIFDDTAPFVELTDPRVVPALVAPAPVSELDGYKVALANARAAGDAAAVAALEASIAAATAPKVGAPAPAPAPAPRAPAAPAMGGGNNLRRGRRVAAARFTAAAQARSTPWPDAPAAKSTKVEREDLPF